VRIVELGSFTAAAADLRERQATVSRWVARLEDELATQLLDRTTRAVRVTDAGRAFYREAREVLAAWDAAVGSVREDEVVGRLRVSVPVVFGSLFVTPRVAEFARAHPGVELELRFDDRYVDLVAAGVDVALRVGRPVDSEYRARTLGSTPRRLVASPSYLDARGRPATPAALADHACLLHGGHDTRSTWAFTRGEDTTRVDVGGRLRANHSDTLRQLACEGLGVALLASWLVDPDLDAGRLELLLPGWSAPPAPVQALFSSSKHTPRPARAFTDFLADALAPVWAAS
jgi:DNA-binding transcriptional LysR family regulator